MQKRDAIERLHFEPPVQNRLEADGKATEWASATDAN
jgi:hypothetical protein